MTRSGRTLKARLKADAERYPDPLRIRLHRSISWLGRAQSESDDLDAQFIFLWIALNAAYAKEFGLQESERNRLADMHSALVAIDHEQRLHKILFATFSGPIRTLLDNKFIFEPFWKSVREHDSSERWKESFANSTKVALSAIMAGDTARVPSVVFDRLYVLRNQLVHGGATWNSKVNRAQLADATRILMALVPAILELMMDHPELDFGPVMYPVI